MSKPSQKKNEKRKKKFQAGKRHRNLIKNLAPPLWRYEAKIDGEWMKYRDYRKREVLQDHLDQIESDRKAGKVLVPGRVVHNATGKILKEVEPSDGIPGAKGPKDVKKDGKPLGEVFEPMDAKAAKGDKAGVKEVFEKKNIKDQTPEVVAQ